MGSDPCLFQVILAAIHPTVINLLRCSAGQLVSVRDAVVNGFDSLAVWSGNDVEVLRLVMQWLDRKLICCGWQWQAANGLVYPANKKSCDA